MRELSGSALQSNFIGLAIMDNANPFFADLARGAEEASYEAGFSVLLTDSGQLQAREDANLLLFKELRVRGLILAAIGDGAASVARLRPEFPVVLAARSGATGSHCTVWVDDITGGRLAAAHLIGQGHRRLAAVGGTTGLEQVTRRREGAAAVAMEHPDVTLLVISTDSMDVPAGRLAAEEIALMPGTVRPTGIFAANDLIAIGLLQGLVGHGLRVPQDVAIIGYDDIEFASAAAVPLSSIRQPRHEIGRRAAQLLLIEIEASERGEEHLHEQSVFAPELVVRASTSFIAGGRQGHRRRSG